MFAANTTGSELFLDAKASLHQDGFPEQTCLDWHNMVKQAIIVVNTFQLKSTSNGSRPCYTSCITLNIETKNKALIIMSPPHWQLYQADQCAIVASRPTLAILLKLRRSDLIDNKSIKDLIKSRPSHTSYLLSFHKSVYLVPLWTRRILFNPVDVTQLTSIMTAWFDIDRS